MVNNGRVYINDQLLDESKYLSSDVYTSGGDSLAEGESYTVKAGELFVMGDNREHSSDSRSWGPITPAKITGRAWVVYWPPNLAGIVKKINY